jgi:hypothetical protein
MGRPKLKNPRRERRVAYFTEDEAKVLDAILGDRYFSLETNSDRLRAALLDWIGVKPQEWDSTPRSAKSAKGAPSK